MKKLLFFLNVPWKWIKQRPHFIAEILAEDYSVTVIDKFSYMSNNLISNPASSRLDFRKEYRLPFDSNPAVHVINQSLARIQMSRQLNQHDVFWFCGPLEFGTYGRCIDPGKTVVYDCMDDMQNMPLSHAVGEEAARSEAKLVERADLLFCSSENLATKIQARFGRGDCMVVNNAMHIVPNGNLPVAIMKRAIELRSNGIKIIAYVGTIDKWFDFEAIIESLSRDQSCAYLLAGPVRVAIPHHDRIFYTGVIKHSEVFSFLALADILVLPFILNELILGVNPVKLYEYIFACKPCVVRRYAETERFEQFVYLYSTVDEFCSTLTLLAEQQYPLKLAPAEYEKFAHRNTWETRARQVRGVLAGHSLL